MKQAPWRVILTLISVVRGSETHAYPLEDYLHVSGFGTFGLAHSNEPRADFVSGSFVQARGAGANHSWSADVDSRLGLQLSLKATDKLSGVIQWVSESSYNNSWNSRANPRYRPSLEWANIKYDFTPDFEMRVGRFALPTFLMSDYRKVGYALLPIRVPVPVYGTVPMSSSDGVDTTYTLHTGRTVHTVHANYGKSDIPAQAIRLKFEDQWGTYYMAETGPLTLRVSYSQTRIRALDPASGQLLYPEIFGQGFGQFAAALNGIPGLASVGAQAAAIARQGNHAVSTYKYRSAGATYDPGTWQLTVEWAKQTNNDVVPDETAGYVLAGYKVKTFTPYIMFAKLDAQPKLNRVLPVSALPPGTLQTAAIALNGLLGQTLAADFSQRDTAVGVRWDVIPKVAVKAQYDRFEFPSASTGFLTHFQSGYRSGGGLDLLSVSLDFIF